MATLVPVVCAWLVDWTVFVIDGARVATAAVSVRSSVKPDAVTCLECGEKMKMLKRHLGTEHGMTPAEYNHPTNLTPRPIMEHRIKTATRDVPTITKGNRISAAHEDFKRRVLAKVTGDTAEEAPKRKATFPGSRQSQFKKKINGRVERRGHE